MRISVDKNVNFKGIRLTNPSFEFSREVAIHLMASGADVLGHKTCYVSNDFEQKHEFFNLLRAKDLFEDDECGVVLLPWSGETYVLATPLYEQMILPVVREVDPGAYIDFSA